MVQAMERERAMAEKMMEDFKSQWAPQLDQVTEAQEMMQQIGATGFDLEPGLWEKQGWLELEKLRPLLDQLKPFERLVKQLGRGGTRGRRRRSLLFNRAVAGRNLERGPINFNLASGGVKDDYGESGDDMGEFNAFGK